MGILIVYDNTVRPGEIVGEIIGEKGFGDVIVRRKLLKNHFRESMEKIYSAEKFQWIELKNLYSFEDLVRRFSRSGSENYSGILHCFSNFVVTDFVLASLTLKKLDYIDEQILLENSDASCIGIMFQNTDQYLSFLERTLELHSSNEVVRGCRNPRLACQGFINISVIRNFIQCLTGNFDSRYFNSMEETDYILRKSSSNKTKIKSEYMYYHLLPENMQRWFVMPFDYRETETTASYAMERLYMTDLAIKWVHGSIEQDEFRQILDMYFAFFRERSRREVTSAHYWAINDELYLKKVRKRIDDLKKLPAFSKIAHLISARKKFSSIDEIFEWYLKIKKKVEAKNKYLNVSVIGHGDPCFANAMYNYSTRTLKFIDPRGALTEEDLYTDPYYDVAKLSHSICGNYDFFNNAMFDITIDENFEYFLMIPFDNSEYKKIFQEKLEENGYDYWTVRAYEASLFLSMLPLHIDYPYKVFGFLLNAVNILREVEENVR